MNVEVVMPGSSLLTLALFQQIGWVEMVIILGVGVLLFGRRLPEVGRNIGRGIVEFKRGVKGIQDEIDDQSREAPGDRAAEPASVARPPLGPGGDDPRVSQGGGFEGGGAAVPAVGEADTKPTA